MFWHIIAQRNFSPLKCADIRQEIFHIHEGKISNEFFRISTKKLFLDKTLKSYNELSGNKNTFILK